MSGKKDDEKSEGSPLGAAIGFLFGGPPGALAGWIFGRQIGAVALEAFEALLPQLEQAMRQFNELTPAQRAEIVNKLAALQSNYGQMSQLSQQKYESRLSDLHHIAASNGLDWSP